MLPPPFLAPNVGVPGAGQFVHLLAPVEGGGFIKAGVNRLVGGSQVIEELGLFIVVQVVLTNVLILCVGVCHGWYWFGLLAGLASQKLEEGLPNDPRAAAVVLVGKRI